MEGLILGVNISYILLCFSKLFSTGCKELRVSGTCPVAYSHLSRLYILLLIVRMLSRFWIANNRGDTTGLGALRTSVRTSETTFFMEPCAQTW